MHARYYGASQSRFMGTDPMDAPNLYTYAEQNPLAYSDPTGMFSAVADGEASMAEQGHCSHCGGLTPGLTAASAHNTTALNPITVDVESQLTGTPGIPFDYSGKDEVWGDYGQVRAVYGSILSGFESIGQSIENVRRTLNPDAYGQWVTVATRTETKSCDQGPGCQEVVVTDIQRFVPPVYIGGEVPLPGSGRLVDLVKKHTADLHHPISRVLASMTLRYGQIVRTDGDYVLYALEGGMAEYQGQMEVGLIMSGHSDVVYMVHFFFKAFK
jgi:hypothetical protein